MDDNKTRPGVILYFSDFDGLMKLNPEQRLAIIEAYVNYARTGAVPEFSDSLLDIIWTVGHYEHTADLDGEHWQARKNKAARAANTRWHKDEQQQKPVDVDALKDLENKL